MLAHLIVGITALSASALTFFSGFGLGTVLMPAFAFFFPVEVAVSMTAIIHLLNNLFKLYLTGRQMNIKIILRFGIPAVLAAFLGAQLLFWAAEKKSLIHYALFGHSVSIPFIQWVMAILIAVFAVAEILPGINRIAFSTNYLPLGGLVSGFFGGLSGHQGAFRSAFLMRCGLTKESFIATNVVIACLVDLSRLTVYGKHLAMGQIQNNLSIVATAIFCAFLGAWLGNRYLKKMTIGAIRGFVALFLFLIAAGLALGLI